MGSLKYFIIRGVTMYEIGKWLVIFGVALLVVVLVMGLAVKL